jgi:MFS family permease
VTGAAVDAAGRARPAGTAAGEPRRRGGLFWHRDFRLLWFGETTSRLGSTVSSVAVPLVAVATLHASTFQVGLLVAASWLPWLVIGLPAGAWVDRLPRRPVLVGCDVISLLAFLSVPIAASAAALTIAHLLAVALVAGTAGVFFQTAYQVYLPSLLTPDDLPEGNAKLQGSESAAQVAGPGLAGLLAALFGAVSGLLADAASFLVSAGCLLSIRSREPARRATRRTTTLRTEIVEGLRFVAGDPYLRVLTAFGAASNLALTGYQAILIVFLVRDVGLSAAVVGGLLAAMSLGGVLGATLATRIGRRFGTAHGTLLCELGAAPFGLLIPLTGAGPRLALPVVGGIVVGAGIVAGNVLKGSFRQTYSPRHLLGRITVSMQLLNYGTIPAGALLAGTLGTTLGVRATIWIMTASLTPAALVLLIGPLRRHRDLPTRPNLPASVTPVRGAVDDLSARGAGTSRLSRRRDR